MDKTTVKILNEIFEKTAFKGFIGQWLKGACIGDHGYVMSFQIHDDNGKISVEALWNVGLPGPVPEVGGCISSIDSVDIAPDFSRITLNGMTDELSAINGKTFTREPYRQNTTGLSNGDLENAIHGKRFVEFMNSLRKTGWLDDTVITYVEPEIEYPQANITVCIENDSITNKKVEFINAKVNELAVSKDCSYIEFHGVEGGVRFLEGARFFL